MDTSKLFTREFIPAKPPTNAAEAESRAAWVASIERPAAPARRSMPAEDGATADLIHAVTGYRTGAEAERHYQPHLMALRPGCYVLHLPSGKVGRVTDLCRIENSQGRTVRGYGLAWDSEYEGAVLRRITPEQYRALPVECRITSHETGIF